MMLMNGWIVNFIWDIRLMAFPKPGADFADNLHFFAHLALALH